MALPVDTAVLDGEAILLRPDNTSNFDGLRSRQGRAEAILVTYDMLEVDGQNMRPEPLEERRKRRGDPRRNQLSEALLMVVACEALKPSAAAYNDYSIYEVVAELLGPEAEARLREYWFQPHYVRSTHVHLGHFHGSELTAPIFLNTNYDPTFDQARRELFRVTQDVIIEWLRRRGEFEPPKLPRRRTFRRRARENLVVVLLLSAVLGGVVGWVLRAAF